MLSIPEGLQAGGTLESCRQYEGVRAGISVAQKVSIGESGPL